MHTKRKRSSRGSRRQEFGAKNRSEALRQFRPRVEQLEDRRLLSVTLPGLHLADPSVDYFDGQVIYLDIDGQEDVTYNGPVIVENVDVPAFSVPDALAGQEQAIIGEVLDHLGNTFAETGLSFTTTRPNTGTKYSTVYIGGNDSEFAEFGSFLGLAEQVDTGNTNPADNGFVFSENFTGQTFDEYASELASVISHESSHLLGWAHSSNAESEGPLSSVAASKSGSNSSNYEYTTANSWIWSPITISGAPSNAVISSVVVSWNVDSNYISDIDWYVENYPNWESSTYTDMVKNGDDWFDGYSETSDTSRTVYPPASCPVNGTWYFNIRDSYDDANADWNKGRIDSWNITINYTSQPDLDAYGVIVSDTTVDRGQSVQVSWIAINRDSGYAGSSQQGIMWSTNSTISTSDRLMERESLGGMNGYQTDPESEWVDIPSDAQYGQTYYIGIYADYDDDVSESNESNNASEGVAVTINDNRSDLEPTAVDSNVWQSAEPGRSVNWTATVRNNGPSSQTSNWTVYWYLSTDTSYGGSDILITSSTYSDDISAGLSKTKTKTANVPSGVSGQQYYVLARVVSSGAEVTTGNNVDASSDRDWFGSVGWDSDELNGTWPFATNLGQVAGTLTRNNRTLDSDGDNDWYKFEMLGTGMAGDKVRLDFAHVEGDVDLWLYRSNGILAPVLIDSSTSSGNFEEVSLEGLSDGTYYFQVDGYEDDVSRDYDITIVVSAMPDLEITSVWTDVRQSAAVGDSVAWSATVGNNGPADLTNNWTVYWYLSTDTSYGGDILVGSETYSDNIGAGAVPVTKTKSFNVPSGAAGQQYYVLARVDTSPDGNSGNNVDASSDRDWFGSVGWDSDELNGTWPFATNLGQVAGTLTRNNRTLDSDGDNDWYKFEMLGTGMAGDKVRLDFAHVEGDVDLWLYRSNGILAPVLIDSSTSSGNFEEVSLEGLSDGTYYFQVDGYEDDVSRDYDITIVVSAMPDLEITSVWTDVRQSAAVGDSVAWSATVGNNGPADLTNNWTVYWYLSTDTSYGGDILVGSETYSDNIGAGAVPVTKTKSFNVPSGAAGQQYYVLARVDTSPDGNSGNNVDASSDRDWFGAVAPDDPDTSSFPWIFDDNDDSVRASDFGPVVGTHLAPNMTLHEDGDNDWYRFTMLGTGGSSDRVRIEFEHDEGDLLLELWDDDGNVFVPAGTLLQTSNGTGDNESISLSGREAGTYYVRVDGVNDDVSRDYDITVTVNGLQVPALSSRPGAQATLYLDFNGDVPRSVTLQEVLWILPITYSVPAIQAYDTDEDPSAFSAIELSNIQEIWSWVAEKYSPFDINVSTVDPGNLSEQQTEKIVIGGNWQWLGQEASGVSAIGGFYDSGLSNICYAFAEYLGGDPADIAETAAHEAGHAFGLTHQRSHPPGSSLVEYYNGDGSLVPIMGNNLNTTDRGVWWLTNQDSPQFSPDSTIDELAVLDNNQNGFHRRADDHGNSSSSADPLIFASNSWSGSGVIEQTTDSDWFSFTTVAGIVSFTVSVAPYGAMLDATLKLLDGDGVLIAQAATSSLGETLTAQLAAESYRMVVSSHGDYGDIGQYALVGQYIDSPPTLSGLPDQTLNEDGSLNNAIDLWAYAADQETADSGLFFSIIGNTNLSSGASIDSNRYIDIAPFFNWYGTSDVTVQVSDGQFTNSDTFRITVNSVNDKPAAQIVSILPSSAQPPGEMVTFDGSSSDVDGTVVAWEWSSNLDGVIGISEDFNRSSYTLTVGSHQISFRVRDDGSLWSTPVTDILTVFDATPTAEISGISNGVSVLPNSTFSVTLGGHDNDENGHSIVTKELMLDGTVVYTGTAAACDVTAPTVSGPHNVSYRVQDDEGTWSDSVVRDFTVSNIDTMPPTVGVLTPADNSAGVAVDTNLVIDFSEDIQKGLGNIVIKKSSDDSVVETIAVTNSRVTVSGDLAAIDPSSDLASDTGYYVQIDSGAFEDLSENDYAGISDKTTWDFATRDTTPPTVVGWEIGNGTAQRSTIRGVRIEFSEDVSASLTTDRLDLQNLTTGETVAAADMAVSYDPGTNTAEWTFPLLPDGKLSEGNYAGRVLAAGIADAPGNPMAEDYEFDFHVFSGDATGDRQVDDSDLLLVQQNYLKPPGPGRDDSADVNCDGEVNIFDLRIVRQNYQEVLEVPFEILVSDTEVAVPEGNTAEFTVVLSADPQETITVTTARSGGDEDLSVDLGAILTFDDTNWNIPQPVTIAAAEDVGSTNGAATFMVAVDGTSKHAIVTATEGDNDEILNLAVTTWDDSPGAVGTLREAIGQAAAYQGDATITVSQIPFIFLVQGPLEYPATAMGTLTIIGPGPDLLMIDGSFQASQVFVTGPGTDVTLSGLTITNGSGSWPGGGGIYVDGGRLSVIDCVISRNTGVVGGGIASDYGTIEIVNSSIIGNSAEIVGGGLYAGPDSNWNISNTVIAGNSAENGGGGFNTGMDIYASATFTNCTVIESRISGDYGLSLTLQNSIVPGFTEFYPDPQFDDVGSRYYADNIYDTDMVSIFGLTVPSAGYDGIWGTGDDVGNPRVSVYSPEIGAYEYAAAANVARPAYPVPYPNHYPASAYMTAADYLFARPPVGVVPTRYSPGPGTFMGQPIASPLTTYSGGPMAVQNPTTTAEPPTAGTAMPAEYAADMFRNSTEYSRLLLRDPLTYTSSPGWHSAVDQALAGEEFWSERNQLAADLGREYSITQDLLP